MFSKYYVFDMKSFFTLLFVAFCLPPGLSAQSSIMAGYVQEAIASNPEFTRAELAVKQQELRLTQARGLFLPKVSLNATYTVAAGGRTIDFPIGDLLNPVYSTLNQLTETQSFPTDLANENIQFLPHNFQETNLRIIQPIFSTSIIANKNAQELLLDASKTSLLITESELIRDVQQAYLGYLQAAEQVRIYEETEALLREQLRVNERLVSANKVTPEAISQAQYALSQWSGNLALAQQQKASARAYVNVLLNRDLRTELLEDNSLVPGAWAPELEPLLSGASHTRQELSLIDQQQDAQHWEVQSQRGQWLPSLNLVADGGFQGFGYDFGNQGFALAQAALSWDLFTGGQRSAAIQESQIASQRLQLQSVQLNQQVALQVEQAWYGWIAHRDTYQAAQDGELHASRLFRQTEQRFLEGQVNALLLEQARASWTQARLSLNASKYAWLQAESNLKFAAGILSID